MPRFRYVARERNGARTEGEIEASDRRAAVRQLQNAGRVPIAVVESASPTPEARSRRRFVFPLSRRTRLRFSTTDLLDFTRELADLLASGMTLSQALHTLARRGREETDHPLIASLRDAINQGRSLSDALAQHPDAFPTFYVSMVRSGEAGGTLAEVLQRLAAHYERVREVREKVITALLYPLIVIIMGVGTLIFAVAFVIPRFAVVFETLGDALPLPTRILIGFSDFVVHRGIFVLALLMAAGIAARRALATENGRLWWHRLQLRLPGVRGIVEAAAYAQFARSLATLLSNGVPVLQALGIVEKIIVNTVIAREIHNARERVTDGATISRPLAAGGVFPAVITDILAVGEQSGDVPGALLHIARRYENELDRRIKIFTTLLEPILIVGVAALVGFVAIAMLLAVFDITSGLNL